jgi:hypothetical protein
MLRDTEEYLFRILWRPLEPIGVIKRSAVNADHFFKPLERQVQFCAALVAEMNVNLFAATFGALLIDLRLAFYH